MTETCQQFDVLIARRAQLTTQDAAKLDAHLAACESCRELARAVKPVDTDIAFAMTNASDADASAHDVSGASTFVSEGANASRERHDPPRAGDTRDRYQITGEVGRGGFGRVLRALDQVLDRPVALKELFAANNEIRRRFIREALITARLQHPSIVPVYDAGRLGDPSPFYAMKLVSGHPFDKAIAEATTLAQRLALLPTVLAIADAMAYAHSERVIHRDLKPTNVLVGGFGETIVIDWGLAKDLAVDDPDALDAGPYRAAALDRTVAGALLGTPAYMAPEQAAGESVDERVDVYAIGAITYHLISGNAPHEGRTLEEMVERVISGDVRPLTEREPDVPRDLAAIVTKAMAIKPADRYPSAQGLADDLRRFSTGQLVASHTYGTRELLRRWIKRHRAVLTAALVALVVVAVIGIMSIVRIVRAQRAAAAAAVVATENLTDLLIDQGRQELLAGRHARAAVYLGQAQAQSHAPGVVLRSLLADAMRSLETERLSLEGDPGQLGATLSHDGRRIAAASGDHTAKVWDATTGAVLATLTGHTQHVGMVAFSPDDSRVVTTSIDGTARVWDAHTGRLVATLPHADMVLSATFSPDGAQILTLYLKITPTGGTGIPKLWDARTGQPLASLEAHTDAVNSAEFSPDGTRIVTASFDHTAKIWDARTGKVLTSLDGHAAGVTSAAFSPDGSRVVTASFDHSAKIWDARTGELVTTLEAHTADLTSAVFSPDGTRIVTASFDHTAKIWDARAGKLLTSLNGHGARVNSAEFSPDGSRVVTASFDHTAKLWDAHTGTELASFEGHRDDVRSAIFNPGGDQILTASADGTVRLWDGAPFKLRESLDVGGGHIASAELSPDGALVVTTVERARGRLVDAPTERDHSDQIAQLWDARARKLLASLEHDGTTESATFDRAGTRVVTASIDQTAKIWDAKTGRLLASLAHDDLVRTAAFSPDGQRIVTVSYDQDARIWNVNDGVLIATLDGHRDRINRAEFSEDGGRVVTASADGTARIWRADTGKLVVELAGDDGDVKSAAFSSDGTRVLTASSRTARLWDAETGKLLASLAGHSGELHAASFSADGSWIVTASADHTAKLWDGRTGTLLTSLEGHTDKVLDAAFSHAPGDARVVTASADHTAKLWDARTGKLLASLDVHTDAVQNAAFSADGTRIMTAGNDGKIEIWDVHLETRTPAAIQSIISVRDPWTLSNGGLIAVAAKPRR